MSRSWIAVASAEHVRRGVALGIMQVGHGKAAPLRRIQPGDRVAYYSPSAVYRAGDKLLGGTAQLGRAAAVRAVGGGTDRHGADRHGDEGDAAARA